MQRIAIIKIAAKPNSVVASQPCPSGHITADKMETKDFPKLPSAIPFIRKPLDQITAPVTDKSVTGQDIFSVIKKPKRF